MEIEVNEPQALIKFRSLFIYLRKIGDDIIIVVDQNSISFRALNSTRSALPKIIFRDSFFRIFKYITDEENIVLQIPASSLILTYKNVTSPLSFTLKVDEGSLQTLRVIFRDKYSIFHKWEFSSCSTTLLNAVFDLDDTVAQVKCRFDVFEGISEAFKKINSIFLNINKKDKIESINFMTSDKKFKETNGGLNSTLTIHKSERCETILADNINEIQISFSLQDFITGIKISKLFSQYFTMHILGPGQPIILKASSTNIVSFEMPLATTADHDLEEIINSNYPQKIENSYDHQLLDSDSSVSQVSAWHLTIPSCLTENSQNISDDTNKIDDMKTEYDANRKFEWMNAMNSQNTQVFENSPQFPRRRNHKGIGEIIQASQPASDNEINSDY
ncbi:hypothetical protein TRFO_41507 [Tritrichomonas foetus]|uniref:DNA repair protein rad9 n=1 Tax=Tritrichomonas foetus TaxID=1144522 RepID=A0A1J4L4J5_9EUKA|nr:hypothetical protein TRFO_41507 [Tritrichomonas foetus]|eukprot:OHT16862.1 hypothetical protein TRFO_41507 [Tritrichomonas foetus]